VLFCTVHYLKATFGPGTSEAVLEMPVPFTDTNMTLFPYISFHYQISSPRIELALLQRKASNTQEKDVVKYMPINLLAPWRGTVVGLDPEVDAFQLIARKTGVTTNLDVDHVLVDDILLGLSEHPCKLHV